LVAADAAVVVAEAVDAAVVEDAVEAVATAEVAAAAEDTWLAAVEAVATAAVAEDVTKHHHTVNIHFHRRVYFRV
jgi:hypothetical protein